MDFWFQGDRTNVKGNLIFAFSACHLLWKGYPGYLVIVLDKKKNSQSLAHLLVVREFSNVFLNNLFSLPTEQEIIVLYQYESWKIAYFLAYIS